MATYRVPPPPVNAPGAREAYQRHGVPPTMVQSQPYAIVSHGVGPGGEVESLTGFASAYPTVVYRGNPNYSGVRYIPAYATVDARSIVDDMIAMAGSPADQLRMAMAQINTPAPRPRAVAPAQPAPPAQTTPPTQITQSDAVIPQSGGPRGLGTIVSAYKNRGETLVPAAQPTTSGTGVIELYNPDAVNNAVDSYTHNVVREVGGVPTLAQQWARLLNPFVNDDYLGTTLGVTDATKTEAPPNAVLYPVGADLPGPLDTLTQLLNTLFTGSNSPH